MYSQNFMPYIYHNNSISFINPSHPPHPRKTSLCTFINPGVWGLLAEGLVQSAQSSLVVPGQQQRKHHCGNEPRTCS